VAVLAASIPHPPPLTTDTFPTVIYACTIGHISSASTHTYTHTHASSARARRAWPCVQLPWPLSVYPRRHYSHLLHMLPATLCTPLCIYLLELPLHTVAGVLPPYHSIVTVRGATKTNHYLRKPIYLSSPARVSAQPASIASFFCSLICFCHPEHRLPSPLSLLTAATRLPPDHVPSF
jgi:hypothetical protein